MDHPQAAPARTPTRTPTRTLALGLAAALTLLLVGCSDPGGGDASAPDATSAEIDRGSASEAEGPAADGGGSADTDSRSAAVQGGAQEGARKAAPAAAVPREVIATGSVEMRSEDVARTRAEIRALVTGLGGLVQAEETSDDDDGTGWSQLTLRVPTARFDAAMERVADLGSRVSVSRSTEDVTTEVADVRVRVANQRRSIERIRQLLAQARSISAIVSIEGELAQREADLASLQAQQEVLADRTSLSTITVSVQRADLAEEEPERDGFLAGLADGWDAMAGAGLVALRVAGVLLPWLVLLGVLAVPGVPLLRRLRARTTARTRSAA